MGSRRRRGSSALRADDRAAAAAASRRRTSALCVCGVCDFHFPYEFMAKWCVIRVWFLYMARRHIRGRARAERDFLPNRPKTTFWFRCNSKRPTDPDSCFKARIGVEHPVSPAQQSFQCFFPIRFFSGLHRSTRAGRVIFRMF